MSTRLSVVMIAKNAADLLADCLGIITPFSTSRPVQRDRYDHIRVPSPDFFLKIFHEFLTVQFPVSSLIVVFELIDRLIHRSFMVP